MAPPVLAVGNARLMRGHGLRCSITALFDRFSNLGPIASGARQGRCYRMFASALLTASHSTAVAVRALFATGTMSVPAR